MFSDVRSVPRQSTKQLKQSGTGNASLGSSNFHVCFGSYRGRCDGSFGKHRVIKSEAASFAMCVQAIQLSVRGWFSTLISLARVMGIAIGLGSEMKNRNDYNASEQTHLPC